MLYKKYIDIIMSGSFGVLNQKYNTLLALSLNNSGGSGTQNLQDVLDNGNTANIGLTINNGLFEDLIKADSILISDLTTDDTNLLTSTGLSYDNLNDRTTLYNKDGVYITDTTTGKESTMVNDLLELKNGATYIRCSTKTSTPYIEVNNGVGSLSSLQSQKLEINTTGGGLNTISDTSVDITEPATGKYAKLSILPSGIPSVELNDNSGVVSSLKSSNLIFNNVGVSTIDGNELILDTNGVLTLSGLSGTTGDILTLASGGNVEFTTPSSGTLIQSGIIPLLFGATSGSVTFSTPYTTTNPPVVILSFNTDGTSTFVNVGLLGYGGVAGNWTGFTWGVSYSLSGASISWYSTAN